MTLPLWDWSLVGASRCENLIDQTQLKNEQGRKKDQVSDADLDRSLGVIQLNALPAETDKDRKNIEPTRESNKRRRKKKSRRVSLMAALE